MKLHPTIAALAAALSAAPALAVDSSVTLYGLIDAGYAYRSDNYDAAKGSRQGFDGGIANGSRLGFRGVEEITPGLKGKFVIEAGINVDTGTAAQSGLTWGRQAWVGLDFGAAEARFGRQYTPQYLIYSEIDPFNHGTVSKASNIFTHIISRADNAAYVTTPFFGDVFSVDAQYAFNRSGDEAVANAKDKRFYAIGPKLQFGKTVKILANYSETKEKGQSNADSVLDIGAVLDFNVVKLTGAYALPKFETTPVKGEAKKYNRFLVGATLPLGNWSLLASYAYSKDKNDLDEKAVQYGIGGSYAFSKRTDTYFGYSRIDANDSLKGKGYSVADSSNAGNDYRSGFNVGIRHKF